jgi:SRSO17 transposase
VALGRRGAQSCGQLGTQENCRVAVSLSAATREASLPIGWLLSLPEEWAQERERRHRAGVPEEVAFGTRPETALGLIHRAVEEDVPMDSCWRMPLMAATRGFGKVWPGWGRPVWWAYSRV